MSDPVIEWLLEPENPSVRFRTLTDLLGKPVDDPSVQAARKSIMEEGLVPRILASQNEDGSWGIPEKFYNQKYTGAIWALLLLAELSADPENTQVCKACEFVLSHSQNPETGGFSYTQSAKTETGLASGVIPCLTGNMVFSLVRLGCLEDPRVQQAINWITIWQRADDGIEKPPKGDMYQRYEMCWGRHSCHMGVAKALKALTAIPPDRRSQAVNDKLDELCAYFIKHHLYKKSHHLDEVSRPGWLKLGFPLMYQTDILDLLSLFADLGRWDSRLQDALAILKSKQTADGRWNLENSFNGKMLVRIDQKGKPSKWITLKALKVIRQFENRSHQ